MNGTTNADPPFVTTLAHAAADPFRLLVEGVKDYAIFMIDPAGKVSSWNPGAEKIKGYQAQEILGRHFSCFYTAEEVATGKYDLTSRNALERLNLDRRIHEVFPGAGSGAAGPGGKSL